MKKIVIIFIMLLWAAAVFAQDRDTLRLRPVSLGIVLQGNNTGSKMNIAEAPGLSLAPGLGGEAGGFIDYNMTRHLLMEFQLLVGMETVRIKNEGSTVRMCTWGMDVPLYLMGHFDCGRSKIYFGGGPFTHFTFGAWSPDQDDFENPYRRAVGIDDVTGETQYALNDNHSGLGLLMGYEWPSGLQVNLSGKYSVTDVINYPDTRSYQHPFKISFGIAYRFK